MKNDTLNVEVLLKYLAMSGENSSYFFRDIMHELVSFKNFEKYLQSLIV